MNIARRSRLHPLELFAANSCGTRSQLQDASDHSGLDETFNLASVGRQWLKLFD
jgi:hypothetical protein